MPATPEPDSRAPFGSYADEARAPDGQTLADCYLNVDGLLAAAARSGAGAIHGSFDMPESARAGSHRVLGPIPQA